MVAKGYVCQASPDFSNKNNFIFNACIVKMIIAKDVAIACFALLTCLPFGESIRCYQCATSNDPKGQDNCGAYKKFDKESNIPIECNSDESTTPGTFCMKVTQQGPKGFIWDGRYRQVIRRCASVAETGVTGVCNWGVRENGIYWEECYCAEDGCNSALTTKPLNITLFALILLSLRLTS